MKRILILTIPFFMLGCGKQLETREHMDEVAVQMSDSINKGLDSSLADPANELNKVDQMTTVKTTTEEDK